MPTLSATAMKAPPPMGHMSESEVIEARVRLVVGLKRYFHGKRVEGLLSTAVSVQPPLTSLHLHECIP